MHIGVDLGKCEDITVYHKTVNIKHKCGHVLERKIYAYKGCFENIGNFEKQIQDKVNYFESLDCLVCRLTESETIKPTRNKIDGLNPHTIIIDEMHDFKS